VVRAVPWRERFWTKVQKTETCWLWTATKNSDGYGMLNADRKNQLAHRLSYEMAYGEIDPGMCVMHLCDVRACVNPEHLWLGSITENNRDCQEKGRRKPVARKLNVAKVELIRRLVRKGETREAVAAKFGVSGRMVGKIVSREAWK
jgi:hypothetical protein